MFEINFLSLLLLERNHPAFQGTCFSLCRGHQPSSPYASEAGGVNSRKHLSHVSREHCNLIELPFTLCFSSDNSLLGKLSGWNNLLSHSSGGWESEIQVSSGKSVPCLPHSYQLFADIFIVPWLVGASPWSPLSSSHGLHPVCVCVRSTLSYKDISILE